LKAKWGSQWNEKSMDALFNSGPTPSLTQAIHNSKNKRCLVLGAGGETRLILQNNEIIGINISRQELDPIKCLNTYLIICDGQYLPLKESCVSYVFCKSTLHHLPNLDQALNEMVRVSEPSTSYFLYEPGILNFFAFIGRKFYPTEIHDPTEKPFIPSVLNKKLSRKFVINDQQYYFIFVHILPILGRRLSILNNDNLLKKALYIDSLLCKTPLKELCWLMIFNLKRKQ
jgi:SAM-dependent methyltransferase